MKVAFFLLPHASTLILMVMAIYGCGPSFDLEDNHTTRSGTTDVELVEEVFGMAPDGKTIGLYTLSNVNEVTIQITNYGATVVSIEVPDRSGRLADVALGYDTLDGYLRETNYLGATVGRVAGDIAEGRFTLDGQEYQLVMNRGGNHLHGGIKGFNSVVWDAEPIRETDAAGVKLSYLSVDGEEGYPGNLQTTVIYTLTNSNELRIVYEATTDAATPVNLTNHTYFNLLGQGVHDVLGHELTLHGDFFTPIDENQIPTGELQNVHGTPMDFTTAETIGARIDLRDEQLLIGNGYDHNWVLNKGDRPLALAAEVFEPNSGRFMEFYTTEPGVQFYTGNYLDGGLVGTKGAVYQKHAGFCLEAQHFPDSPNQSNFPSTILRPGGTYTQQTVYKFLTK